MANNPITEYDVEPDPQEGDKYKFEIDDTIWIMWSNGAKRGWVTERRRLAFLTREGTFPIYTILQEDGREIHRMVERLLVRRDLDDPV